MKRTATLITLLLFAALARPQSSVLGVGLHDSTPTALATSSGFGASANAPASFTLEGYNASGIAPGATYISGITATGAAHATCTLTFSSSGSPSVAAVGTVMLSATNIVAAGSRVTFSNVGTGYGSAPTSAVASNGTATCSGTVVVAATLGAYAPLAVDAGGNLIVSGGGSPGGSEGQIQWNHLGAFDGASGFTTDGVHTATGAGSAVDTGSQGPPPYSQPIGPTVQVVNETSTDPALESGQFINVTLNPASTATAGGVSAAITQLDMEGTGGWAGSNVFASAQSAQAIYNSPDDAGTTLDITGSAPTVYNANTGKIQYAWGTTPSVLNIGGGTIYQGVGTESSVNNNAGGSMTEANANYAYLNLLGVGTTAFASLYSDDTGLDTVDTQTVTTWVGYNFGAAPTVTNGGSIGTLCGLCIGDMNTGTTNYEIYVGSAPSYIGGPTTFGDIVAPGILTLAQGTNNIATAGGEGWQFNCSDCDTPLTEGATCTAAGDHAGTLAIALRGAIKCF